MYLADKKGFTLIFADKKVHADLADKKFTLMAQIKKFTLISLKKKSSR